MLRSLSQTFTRATLRFYRGEEGVTAVECALLLALVVTICVVALTPFNQDGAKLEPTIIVAQQ